MNWKTLVAILTVLIVAVAAIWIYMVKSYESDLGTSNVVVVEASGMQPDNNSNNELLHLSFADDAEDLLWSSLEVSLVIDGQTSSCSFGSQSNSNLSGGKVSPKLGADGLTFTTIIDSTDEDEYTYFDLSEQEEVDEEEHWMRFSSTDIYLNDGISWVFLAILAEKVVGKAKASSKLLVCKDWVPPRTAAIASTVVLTILL